MKTYARTRRPTPLAPHRARIRGRQSIASQASMQRSEVRRILHGPRLQAKLTVGPPGDAYEREADRVADAVMRMPEPAEKIQRVRREMRRQRIFFQPRAHTKARVEIREILQGPCLQKNGPSSGAPASPPSWLNGVNARHAGGNLWRIEVTGYGETLVGPYRELATRLRAAGFGEHAHHIVGGEHLRAVGSSWRYQNAPSVALAGELHEQVISPRITAEQRFLGGRPRGGRLVATRREVAGLYRNVYTRHTGFLELATIANNIFGIGALAVGAVSAVISPGVTARRAERHLLETGYAPVGASQFADEPWYWRLARILTGEAIFSQASAGEELSAGRFNVERWREVIRERTGRVGAGASFEITFQGVACGMEPVRVLREQRIVYTRRPNGTWQAAPRTMENGASAPDLNRILDNSVSDTNIERMLDRAGSCGGGGIA